MRIIITFLISLLCLSNICFAYDYYSAAKKAYEKSKLKRANYFFEKVLEKSPDHIKARYYYAQTFLELEQFIKAEKEYEKVIEKAPQSKEAKLAIVGISQIHRHNLLRQGITLDYIGKKRSLTVHSVGQNYIENALNSGKVLRWSTDQMPIKVYIERAEDVVSYQDYYYSAAHSAVHNWINGVEGGLLSYELTNDIEQADIQVLFVNDILKKTGKTYVSGLATPFIRGDILDHFKLKLKTTNFKGNSFSHREIYFTALHEFGHALGIVGHSSKNTDIMYSAMEGKLENEITGLSTRDINTLTLLYTLDPDISNFKNGVKPETASNRNEQILGSTEQRLNNKLKEAIEYTEKYPRNVLSWAQLGNAYSDLGYYKEAIISYKKALEIDPTYTNALEKLAFTYKDMGDFSNASATFSRLVRQNPSNMAYSHNYALYLIENKKYQEASAILNNLFKVNPQAKSNENIVRLINYLKQQNI